MPIEWRSIRRSHRTVTFLRSERSPHAKTCRPHYRGRRRNRPRPRHPPVRGIGVNRDARPLAARWLARAARLPRVHRLDHSTRACSIASWPSSRSTCVFHLAALLSTRSEFTPMTAHHVNVEGTLNLLEFAQQQGESHGRPVVFLYPSSIAAYGLPDARDEGARRHACARTSSPSDHDVRVQQALLRAARALLRAPLQAARRRMPVAARSTSAASAFPG